MCTLRSTEHDAECKVKQTAVFQKNGSETGTLESPNVDGLDMLRYGTPTDDAVSAILIHDCISFVQAQMKQFEKSNL